MRRTMVRRAAAVLVVLALGACGDGDDGEEGVPGGAKGRVVRAGDPICADLTRRVGMLGDDPAGEFPLFRDAGRRLDAIDPPGEDEHLFSILVREIDNVGLSLEHAAKGQELGDRNRVGEGLADARQNLADAREAADEYGFQDCARLGT